MLFFSFWVLISSLFAIKLSSENGIVPLKTLIDALTVANLQKKVGRLRFCESKKFDFPLNYFPNSRWYWNHNLRTYQLIYYSFYISFHTAKLLLIFDHEVQYGWPKLLLTVWKMCRRRSRNYMSFKAPCNSLVHCSSIIWRFVNKQRVFFITAHIFH